VFTSNPAYIELMEGPAGYSLAQFQRDWQVAQTSGRTMLSIRRRADQTVVGVAEFLEHNPDDDRPWLGLLIIRGDLQRQGHGSEALRGLLEYGTQARGWPELRIAVNEPDQGAMHFWQQEGFRPY
jgi:RimJ/RimL family protein N-acetyltransferase